jgi:flagellar biosynthesis component FlhA
LNSINYIIENNDNLILKCKKNGCEVKRNNKINRSRKEIIIRGNQKKELISNINKEIKKINLEKLNKILITNNEIKSLYDKYTSSIKKEIVGKSDSEVKNI